jgi:DNA invertase Pin-like site-specific DNA recombinase
MHLVRRNKVDVVACFKLDRLGRSLPHLAQIITEFDQHNVAIVATSDGIDTNQDSPAGRLQMHVLMAMAQFERSLIVERVRAGQAAARAKGVKFGRPATLHKHKDTVMQLLGSGWSCRRIASSGGCVGAAKVKKLISGRRTFGNGGIYQNGFHNDSPPFQWEPLFGTDAF